MRILPLPSGWATFSLIKSCSDTSFSPSRLHRLIGFLSYCSESLHVDKGWGFNNILCNINPVINLLILTICNHFLLAEVAETLFNVYNLHLKPEND